MNIGAAVVVASLVGLIIWHQREYNPNGTIKKLTDYELKHFEAWEFGQWFDRMDKQTLICLDKFREAWGDSVIVSSADGGLGRELGQHHNSMHNVDKHGKVKAVDFFPTGLNVNNARHAFALAKKSGFTGIGLYPFTTLNGLRAWMMHGDTRADRTPTNPAKWARMENGEYTAIEQAFNPELVS